MDGIISCGVSGIGSLIAQEVVGVPVPLHCHRLCHSSATVSASSE